MAHPTPTYWENKKTADFERELAGFWANIHRQIPDEEITDVFLVPNENFDSLRLVEVNALNPSAQEVWVVKFAEDPARDLPLPLEIAVLGEGDVELLQSGRMEVPEGWPQFSEWIPV